jgi:hypothetical protein
MEYDPLAAFTAWTRALKRLTQSPNPTSEMLDLVLYEMHLWGIRLQAEMAQYRVRLEKLVLQ